LLRETPTELFDEWRALYDEEPWADERLDFAIGTAIAHNYACHPGADPRPPIEYMQYLKQEEEQKQSREDMVKIRENWAAGISKDVEKMEGR
jgi:hypothetical protein